VYNATITDGPKLYHELTHVWQAKKKMLTEIYLYAAGVQITEGDPGAYIFSPGAQWSEYNIEQQASIVEAWTLGATSLTAPGGVPSFDRGTRGKFSIDSPVFRYINGNVRRSDNGAVTGSGSSVRQLLADGGHRTMKDMHSKPPSIWWP